MDRRLVLSLIAVLAVPAHADSLSDAFNQGTTLGRSGNAAASGQISGSIAQATVPNYTTAPPEAGYFGSSGLGTLSSARIAACAGSTGSAGQEGNLSEQGCTAIDFSQTNAFRRPVFSIAPNDPLRVRARTITADPQAIAGNLAGTYSGCSVQTATQPDIFETQICHQYRGMEQLSCENVLTVQVSWSDSCPQGTWFGNFWVNTWGNGEVGRRYAGVAINGYCQMNDTLRIALHAICTEEPCAGDAELHVDATSGAPSPQTFSNFIGRSWYATDLFNRVDYSGGGCTDAQCRFDFCTRYEESNTTCDDQTDECQTTTTNETRACGSFSFERPHSIATVTDAWDNQCAALEARSQ